MRDDVARYLTLTKTTLPALAKDPARGWPVRNDHCFQRIVLDTICGGVWYDHIQRPASTHMSDDQAARAAALPEAIAEGTADLHALNAQSKRWRAERRQNDPQQAFDL